MSNQGLLPSSATEQEVALSEATARISQVPILVRESCDPFACPASLLPWLAWAKSVDDWDDSWTETQKRNAIASSYGLHRKKGTVWAVKLALDAIGYPSRLTEWFQADGSGDPYTFNVRVGITDRGIDAATTATITRRIDAAKNLRSHYTLSLVMTTDVGLGVAAVPAITPRYICRPYQASLPTTSTAAPLGGLPRIAANYRVSAL